MDREPIAPQNLRETPPQAGLGAPPTPEDAQTINVVIDGETEPGKIEIKNPDGSVTITFGKQPKKEPPTEWDANLAEHLSQGDLGNIVDELLQAIEEDINSRSGWIDTTTQGMDLLGLEIKTPSGDTGSSQSPIQGMSTVNHPALLECCIRFQSNARGELLPANGPVKVRDDAPPKEALDPMQQQAVPQIAGLAANTGEKRETLAEKLEKDFNHYLTVTDKKYYPDTDRLLFGVGFRGCGFKKVYHHPIKKRPVSESVSADDLIISNLADDIESAARVTHKITMRLNQIKQMELAGVYIEGATEASPSYSTPDPVQQKTEEIQGVQSNQSPANPKNQQRTIYECYCELDLPGFEHKDGKDVTGLALPYRVTIDKDDRRILEIRRNYEQGDEDHRPKQVFVKYPFIPAFGFYDIGLVQVLGNSTNALSAVWREMLDAGMFACFPGFLYAKLAGRQNTNEFQVPPGGGIGVDLNGMASIKDAIMPVPYREAGPALTKLSEDIAATVQRVGGTAEIPVGEGKQDAPVGTTLALIEQATKMEAAVHKRLYAAQSEEFQILKRLFSEDPESFWRGNRKPANKWDAESLKKALNDYDLVPCADPNTPSHMHRIMKAVAIKQLHAANPGLYDGKAVDSLILRMIGISDPDSLFAPPQPQGPPPPDPLFIVEMAKVMNQARDIQEKYKDKAAERASKEEIAILNLAKEIAIHGASPEMRKMMQDLLPKAGDQPMIQGGPQQQPGMNGIPRVI